MPSAEQMLLAAPLPAWIFPKSEREFLQYNAERLNNSVSVMLCISLLGGGGGVVELTGL